MRKTIIIAVSAGLAVLTVSLAACQDKFKEPAMTVSKPETFSIQFEVPIVSETETDVMPPQTSATSAITATSAADPIIETQVNYTEIAEKEMDERTEMLFTAFSAGDKKTLSFLGTGSYENTAVYDFVDNITFGEYEIKPLKAYYSESGGIDKKDYEITLEVKKSEDERFPEGTHTYNITALEAIEGAFFTQLIKSGDSPKQAIINSYNGGGYMSVNAYTCYDLTLEMLPFYGRESAESFTVPTENKAEFYSGLSRFFSHISVAENGENPENYNAAAKSYFGIDTEFTVENVAPLWYGANSLEAVLVSENDNSVVIDYYADSLFLVKAFTVKYNFDTTDGFSFTSLENLYDSGFSPDRHTT
jgi:hypothetical protein